MEKICTCIKNIGVWHSFEKNETATMFFLKKPFLVRRVEIRLLWGISLRLQGILIENLMMKEEEERDFETFTLASPNVRRGKTLWKASQENKFYSQAQQARHQTESLASQARSLDSVDQGQGQAQPLLLDQAQDPAQVQPAGQDQFPVLLPQGQGRPLLVLAHRGDLYSLYGDENFSLGLDNEAALREKQARSEALDKMAEFCKLDRQDSDAKREVMSMSLPVYSAPARKSIELSLLWHSSTIPIADRNHLLFFPSVRGTRDEKFFLTGRAL